MAEASPLHPSNTRHANVTGSNYAYIGRLMCDRWVCYLGLIGKPVFVISPRVETGFRLEVSSPYRRTQGERMRSVTYSENRPGSLFCPFKLLSLLVLSCLSGVGGGTSFNVPFSLLQIHITVLRSSFIWFIFEGCGIIVRRP